MTERLEDWYIGEKIPIDMGGLKIHGGAYLNGADLTGELRTVPPQGETVGVVVAGSTFSLTYTPASDGNYSGFVPATAELVRNTIYELFVIDTDTDEPVQRVLRGRAVYRGKT